jgi:AraC-like DNA-binding protein
MYTMTEELTDTALRLGIEVVKNNSGKWMLYSQAIAAIMSNRMEEFSMTRRALAEKMNCSQQYISKLFKE